MKIALLSDPHFTSGVPIGRVDDTAKTSIRKFSFVIDYCKKKEMPLLIAGDLCNTPRSWYTLSALANILRNCHVVVCCVYGQHDLYRRETKKQTTLGALSSMGAIRVLGKGTTTFDDVKSRYWVNVYGCSWGEEVPPPKKINKETKNVLVIHAPITSTHVPHDYIDARRFLKTNKAYHLILCGDIHKQFFITSKNRFIINTGPMLRLAATEEMHNHTPTLFIWDTEHDSFDKIQIPHKPAEEVLTRDHIEQKNEKDEMLKEFITTFKKGVKIREKKASTTFNKWAKENKLNGVIRKSLFERLKGAEDESNETGTVSKEIS